MEVVEQQKQLLNQHITTLFQQWQQQLREETKRCDVLHEKVKQLQKELNTKNETILRLTHENSNLKEEATRSQLTSRPDDSPRLKALIEKHNNLYREHELLKSTAAADQRELIMRLRKEREKLKSWNRFSSPGSCPAHSPATAAAPTRPSCADPVDRRATRIDLLGNEDHADCQSHTQGYGSQHEGERGLAESVHRARESEDGQGLYDSQGNANTLQNHAAVSKESKAMGQPEKPPQTNSTFVDSHLSHEPRGPSPELPPIAENRQSLKVFNGEMPVGTDQDAPQQSLPQVQRSDSTAPPSEVVPAVNTNEASAGNDSGPETPQFLGARSVIEKVSRRTPGTGGWSAGTAMEPVTIKSDPDTSFATSRPPQPNGLASSMNDSLDPSTSISEQSSPRKQRPRRPKQLPHSDAALPESLTRMQSVTRRRSSAESVPLQNQSFNGQPQIENNAEQTTLLRPIDGNARKLPRTAKGSFGLKSKKRRTCDGRGVEAIPTISEDGEEFVKRARKASKGSMAGPRLTNQSAHLRLDSLLADPADRKTPLMPASKQDIADMEERLTVASAFCTPSNKRSYKVLVQAEDRDREWWSKEKGLPESKHIQTPSIPVWYPPKSQQRKSPMAQSDSTPKPAPVSESRIEKTSVSGTTPTASAIPRSSKFHNSQIEPTSNTRTPYRTLPLASLNLSHFKLNPCANHNLTYAYVDVVRDQSERKCLPGCTRPECCGGKFAALAQTLPPQPQPHARLKQPPTTTKIKPATTPDPNPNTLSTTTTSTAADEAALQSYLGNHYHALTPQERASHLDAARTQHLANKYGKAHRHLHQRAPSPPGFWNVDFPATQEREEEHRVADERERAEVQRRWRESMKNADPREMETEGERREKMWGMESKVTKKADEMGLWMFADE